MPRSLNICTAAAESASEMRTLGAMASGGLCEGVLALGERPIEPGGEGLDIGSLDCRSAPDAQSCGRVAIGIDVVSDAFLFQHCRQTFHKRGLRLGGEFGDRGIDDLQADGGV